VPARERKWETKTGKANFVVPGTLDADPDIEVDGRRVLRLTTLRSDDQFNTTVYGLDDRFRGIRGTRMVLLANAADLAAQGLRDGDLVTARTHADDGIERSVAGLRVREYDIPRGCLGGYFPECNPLVPLWPPRRGQPRAGGQGGARSR
jgi:anaerobic selenocysteine-containing dehydrogenase